MISQTHNFCPISNMDSNSRSRGKGRRTVGSRKSLQHLQSEYKGYISCSLIRLLCLRSLILASDGDIPLILGKH